MNDYISVLYAVLFTVFTDNQELISLVPQRQVHFTV